MGYRMPDDREHRPHRHIDDMAGQSVISVDNGSISRITIPCFYVHDIPHSRKRHDHRGWPTPDRTDHSCQLPPRHERIIEMTEIDLPGEGYDSIEAGLADAPDGLSITGTIEHNIVMLSVVAMCEAATKEDLDVPFSVYATGEVGTPDGKVQLRDVVTKGILHVCAGPIG